MKIKSGDKEAMLLWRCLLIPALVLALMWLILGADMLLGLDLGQYGIVPLEPIGLIGIITSPLLHADIHHLAANSVPFFLLFAGLIYYYRDLAWKILIYSWLITGLWVWCFARGDASHIGASGVIYALAAFHFFSGIIRNNKRLSAFSLLVVFLYGSLIWGVFPELFMKENISWESHLMGGLAGTFLAFYFQKEGPGADKYAIDEENDDDDNLQEVDDGTAPYYMEDIEEDEKVSKDETKTENR
ncbi:MAG: rhomboid family intramembrane serine protease [Bacteroidetes bacterium]|nr:rhomboid family intramembrane serine protease [Bacteroidota bacterium]